MDILNWSPNPFVTGRDGATEVVGTGFDAAEGPGDSQARQFDLSFGFETQQTEHVQESEGGLNLSPNPDSGVVVGFSVTILGKGAAL